MLYDYATERPKLFTEDGQVTFLKIRDNVNHLIKLAGAARMAEIMTNVTGDSWQIMACVDRLVELGELREVTDNSVMGQHRIFTEIV